jgi:type II secretory ATPase GspE/PulE/Tfp pilus assembly ATPase PilB-like protein
VARLLDLGAEPYLVASSLLGVLAQRLVRRVCPECREVHTPTPEDLVHWDLDAKDGPLPTTLYRGKGCKACLDTGYHERVGVFELLTVSEPIRELILARAKASSIKAEAIRNGMKTLRADGITKAATGVTTLDEVVRVSERDEF